MKKLLIIAASFLVISCGYSPLDTYVSATVTSDSLNQVAEDQARQYIENLNQTK